MTLALFVDISINRVRRYRSYNGIS